MATHKEIKELLEGFALGELSEQQSSEVKEHIARCERCSDQLKRLCLVLECADQRHELSADEQLCSAANEAILSVTKELDKTGPKMINLQNVKGPSSEALSEPTTGSVLSHGKFVVDHRTTWVSRWLDRRIIIAASIFFVAGLVFGYGAGLLTPKERIEIMKEIQEEYAPDERYDTFAAPITISGTVRTFDGRSLPSDSRVLKARSIRKGGSGSYGIRLKDGYFSQKVDFGRVYLISNYEGYAPAFAGPFSTEPNGIIDSIELVLESGFEGRIRIIDENGDSVPNARLTGGYSFAPGVHYNNLEFVSDQDGVVVIEHCGNKPLRFTVTVEGLESDQKEFELEPEVEQIWQLKRSDVTSGMVVSATTGEPIANTSLTLIRTEGPDPQGSDPYRSEAIAVTDEQGRFNLTSLRADSVHYLLIKAAGYGTKCPYKVMAGQQDLRIELGKELYIQGKIIGDLERLSIKNGKGQIHYNNPIRYGNNKYGYVMPVEVEIQDGVGYFTIDGLWPGTVRINVSGKRFTFEIDREPLEDVVLDLTPEPEAAIEELAAKRELVVKFDTADCNTPPAGSVWISFSPDDRTLIHRSESESLPIEDGQVRVEVAAPGKLHVEHRGMIGYYVKWKDQDYQIPAGEGVFEILVPVIPAGSIYGEILERDGSKASNVMVMPVEVKSSPLKKQGSLNVQGKSGASPHEEHAKFIMSPLPLGGEYAAVARQNESYVVSEAISIDESNPIVELNMQLVEGLTVSGQVVDPNGYPIAGVMFGFDYSTPWSHGFGGRDLRTDNKGRFVIEHVNPDVPGHYSLSVEKAKGCRPFRMQLEDFNTPLIIKLEKAHGVSGVVVDDETGWPIPGIEVFALPKNHDDPEPTGYLDAEEKTDENGRFRFTNMGQREYVLHTRGGRWHSHGKLVYGSYAVTVVGGQSQEVTIRKRLQGGSNLKPQKPQDIGE